MERFPNKMAAITFAVLTSCFAPALCHATEAPKGGQTVIASNSDAMAASTTPYIYSITDGEADIWAYLRYDTRMRTYGLARLTTAAPSTYALVRDYGTQAGTTPVLTAGTFVGDKFFAYETTLYANTLMPEGISVVDLATGTLDRRSTIENTGSTPLIIDEMTYDPKTQALFGMHYDTDAFTTDLYRIDTTTLELSKVATIKQPFFTLAADNGYLYAIAGRRSGTACSLVRVAQSTIDASAQTCEVETVSPASGTGFALGNYSQSMEFDKTTHRLWWAAQGNDDKAYLIEMDTQTGLPLSKKELSGNPQFIAVGIPYQCVADEAPSYVKNLSAKTGAQGELSAQLSWKNPEETYRLSPLASLSSVKVYRNGQLAATLSPAQTAQEMQWTDNAPEEGLTTYRVTAENEAGEGVYREQQIFVGTDVPGAPQNVKLTASGATCSLSWTTPQEGANGGYFDATSVKYDVLRLPDSVTVAQGTTALSLTDHVEAYQGYSYVVTAVNDHGRGASATSNTVACGEGFAVPFSSPLTTNQDFSRWTVLNANNDDRTWAFSTNDACAMYDRSEENAADDWLVSPPLILEKEKQYQLRYTYSTINWVDGSHKPIMEKMKVYYGQQPTTEALTQLIADLGEFHTASGEYLYGKDVFSPSEDGVSYVAFQANSIANRGRIYLRDISLREYSATDLSATALTGSATANVSISQMVTVSVGNEGTAAVSGYKVQLINTVTGEVVAETDGKTVQPGETVDVPVEWTPLAEGEITLQGKVAFDADTYPADNLTTATLTVKISSATDDRWITLGSYDTSGWNVPFYLAAKYAQVQSLYLEREMQKTGIKLTGMQVAYDGNYDGTFSFPARVSLKASDRTDLCDPADEYTGQFETEGWTTVFDGELSVSGKAENSELAFSFDTPYIYNGGNLNVKFEVPLHNETIDFNNHPNWHFYEPSGKPRTAYFRGTTDQVTAADVFSYPDLPFMLLSYTGGGESGIISPASAQFAVWQSGQSLLFSKTCEKASLYAADGRILRTVSNARSMSVSDLATGVYVLRATADGKTFSVKMALR